MDGNYRDEFSFGPPSFGNPMDGPPGPMMGGPADLSGGPPPGPQRHSQVQLWQEQNYMGGPPESGFISASTTQPSSVTGHEDGLEDGCYTGPGSIVSGSLYDLDSGAPSEVSSIASTHPMLTQDPSESIPTLAATLDDDDPVIVTETLHLLERAVKKDHFNERFFGTMIRSQPLIQAIVAAMGKALSIMIDADKAIRHKDEDMSVVTAAREALESAEKRARIASDILRAMANEPSGRRAQAAAQQAGTHHETAENRLIACRGIVMAQGILPLTHLLQSNLERIKYNCVITIHTVLLSLKGADKEEAKKQFKTAGGVHVMTDLLDNHPNPKFLSILCDSLYLVAVRDKEIKKIILNERGTERVIKILSQAKYPNLIERALKLFQGLAICPHNKKRINDEWFGIELLANFLRPDGASEKDMIGYYAASSMRNLSDSGHRIQNPDQLTKAMLNALTHKSPQVVECVLGAIANLTVINEKFKEAIFANHGIQKLVRGLDLDLNKAKLVDPAICALRALTNKHPNSDQMQMVFIQETRNLHSLKPWLSYEAAVPRQILKASIQIVKNLGQKVKHHALLRDEGFVSQVIDITDFMAKDMAMKGLFFRIDDITVFEMLENCLHCLLSLSSSKENRVIVYKAIPTCKKVLEMLNQYTDPSKKEQVLRLTRMLCSILNELTTREPEGAFYVEQFGTSCQCIEVLIGRFQNATQDSGEHKIATLASSIMNEIERVKQAVQRGDYAPPQLTFPPSLHPLKPPGSGAHSHPPPNNSSRQAPPNPFPGMPPGHYGGPPGGPMGQVNFATPPFHSNFPPQQGQQVFDDMMSDMSPMGGGPPMHGFDGGMPPMDQPGGPPPPPQGDFMSDEMYGLDGSGFFGGQQPIH